MQMFFRVVIEVEGKPTVVAEVSNLAAAHALIALVWNGCQVRGRNRFTIDSDYREDSPADAHLFKDVLTVLKRVQDDCEALNHQEIRELIAPVLARAR